MICSLISQLFIENFQVSPNMDNGIVLREPEIAVRGRRASLSPLFVCLHILTHYVSIYSLNHTGRQNNIWNSVSSQDRHSLSTTVCGVPKDTKVEKNPNHHLHFCID